MVYRLALHHGVVYLIIEPKNYDIINKMDQGN